MTELVPTSVGLAFIDSLNVLNIGIVSAVVYDSRLNRHSALPGGLSYIAGVLVAIIIFGLCAVLGLGLLTDLPNFNLTPTARYWGEFLLGLMLIVLASLPMIARTSAPGWALAALRQRPWILGFVGAGVGLGQACTSVPYLAALTMIAVLQPRLPVWPVIVIAYGILALLPCMTVLGLSTSRRKPVERAQRWLVKR